MQETIAPGDQMWVNLAQLVRQRIPDRKGNELPTDVGSVTYDLRDLTPGGHNLIANELAFNNTFGSNIMPACPDCCGWASPYFDPDFADLFIGGTDPLVIDEVNSCTGSAGAETADATDWGSDDTAVATLSTGQATGVGAGSTTGFAYEAVEVPGECACNKQLEEVQLPVTVQVPTSLTVLSVTVLPNGSGPPNGCPGSANYGIMRTSNIRCWTRMAHRSNPQI